MRMRKWPIMIIAVKILIWMGHERKELKNDGRGEGWMKIDYFILLLLLYYFCTHK